MKNDQVTEVWDMVGKYFHSSVSTYAILIHGICKGKLEKECKYFEMMID